MLFPLGYTVNINHHVTTKTRLLSLNDIHSLIIIIIYLYFIKKVLKKLYIKVCY